MSRPRREKRRSIRRRRWGNCRCRRSSPTGRTSECTASRGLQYCPVRYSPKAARQAGRGARQKADNFLPKPLARGIVFQKSAAPRPGLLIGAGHSSFGGGAKRNGVEAIENNEFREMPHFAPLMISRAYACVAKSFASLREMNPSASPGSARRRRPKRGLRTRATALRGSAARKGGRRSQMAPQVADIVQNGIEMPPRLPDAREPIRRSPLSC